MNEKKRPAETAKKVLGDYKKVGSTFVPPMIHRVGPMDYTSWSSQTLPELIWWDAIIDYGSLRFATKIAEEIAKHLKPSDPRERWFGFISDYAHLSVEDMSGLKEHLKRQDLLADLTGSLANFVNLYPACPFRGFLTTPRRVSSTRITFSTS